MSITGGWPAETRIFIVCGRGKWDVVNAGDVQRANGLAGVCAWVAGVVRLYSRGPDFEFGRVHGGHIRYHVLYEGGGHTLSRSSLRFARRANCF